MTFETEIAFFHKNFLNARRYTAIVCWKTVA